jgi:hypothetical protein
MSDEPQPGVIGSLPRTRPHRRSDKRAAAPAGAPPVDAQSAAEPAVVKAAAAKRPPAATAAKRAPAATKPKRAAKATAQAKHAPAAPRKLHAVKPARAASPTTPTVAARPEPAPADAPHGVLETAVQAAAELAEIGLHASARALRRAASRLPRP